MKGLNRLLLVEDDAKAIRVAADVAKSVGVTEVKAYTSVPNARAYLENGLQGEETLPDGIVLDLDMGYDSGYELLRLWHSTPRLREIPVMVWSILGEEQRDMCSLFHVNRYVGKWEGLAALREALSNLVESAS